MPFETVDSYIQSYPKSTQEVLQRIRKTIKPLLPEADEVISYGIPTFKQHGKWVIYYAGYAKHVSIHPIPDDKDLLKELKPFIKGKGTLQFPLDRPIPYDLIKKVALAFKKIRSAE